MNDKPMATCRRHIRVMTETEAIGHYNRLKSARYNGTKQNAAGACDGDQTIAPTADQVQTRNC